MASVSENLQKALRQSAYVAGTTARILTQKRGLTNSEISRMIKALESATECLKSIVQNRG